MRASIRPVGRLAPANSGSPSRRLVTPIVDARRARRQAGAAANCAHGRDVADAGGTPAPGLPLLAAIPDHPGFPMVRAHHNVYTARRNDHPGVRPILMRRKFVAILFADIVGYSELCRRDEGGTRTESIAGCECRIRPAILRCRGRLIAEAGMACWSGSIAQ